MNKFLYLLLLFSLVLTSGCDHEESVDTTIKMEFEKFSKKYGIKTKEPTILFTIDGNECNVCAEIAEQYHNRLLELNYKIQSLACVNGRKELVEYYRERGYSIPVAQDSNFSSMKSLNVNVFPSLSILSSLGNTVATFSIEELQKPSTFDQVRLILDSVIIEHYVNFPQQPDKVVPLQTSKDNYIASIQTRDRLYFNRLKKTFFVPDDSRNKIYEIDLNGKFVSTVSLDAYRRLNIDKPTLTLQHNDTLIVLARVETHDKSVVNAIMSDDEHESTASTHKLDTPGASAAIPMPYAIKIYKNGIDTIRVFDVKKRCQYHSMTYNTNRNTVIGGVIYVDYGYKDIKPLSQFPSLFEYPTNSSKNLNYFHSYDSSYLYNSVPYFESPTLVYFSDFSKSLTTFDRCSEWLQVYDASYNLIRTQRIYPPANYIKWKNLRKFDRVEMMKAGDVAEEYYKYFTPVTLKVQDDGSTIIIYEKSRDKLAIVIQKYDIHGKLIVEKSIGTTGESRFIDVDDTNMAWFLNLDNNSIEKYSLK